MKKTKKLPEALVTLRHVDVALDGQIVLRDLNWTLRAGEKWAILGRNGSGKSTFLKMVRGEIWPAPKGKGERWYGFDGHQHRSPIGVREKMGFVSPELQERYLQQEWSLTALDVIYSGFYNSDYLPARPDKRRRAFAESLARYFGVQALLKRNIQQLSTGETRKILIVRALVSRPRVLILDEVCDGLDARTRLRLLETVEQAAAMGTQLLFTTHRGAELPEAITHVAILDKGQIIRQGPKLEVSLIDSSAPGRGNGIPNGPIWKGVARIGTNGPPLIAIERANVYLERKKVLQNITWQVRSGENWAIFGRNGAGKSTLLKLAFGDLHPAWGASIKRFEFTAKNTIWDLRKKVGFVSPELQAHYREDLTGAEVVASGLFSSVGLMDRISEAQRRKVQHLLRSFGLEAIGRRCALKMSYGEFRKMLLLRALVQEPELVICDEPFDGLDARSKSEFSESLDKAAMRGTRLVLVTHHLEDLPSCISHGLLLEKGRIVCQGEIRKVWKHPALNQLFGPGSPDR